MLMHITLVRNFIFCCLLFGDKTIYSGLLQKIKDYGNTTACAKKQAILIAEVLLKMLIVKA